MKKTSMILLSASILTTLVGGYTVQAAKNEGAPVYSLDEVVVTATTTPRTLKNTNASVSVITKEEIENNHYDTLSDALEHIPNINSVKFADGAGFEISGESSMTIRGTSKALVVVDGVVQKAGNSYKNYLLNMNMDDVERIEVLRGSASTLYGADAVGGVVNIITKKNHSGNSGKVGLKVGNFGVWGYHIHDEGGDDKVFYSATYDKSMKGDYEDGYGVDQKRSVNSNAVSAKIGYHLNETTDFTIKYDDNDYRSRAIYDMPNWGLRHWNAYYRSKMLTGTLDYHSKDGKQSNQFSILYGSWYSNRERSTKGNQPAMPWEKVDRDNISVTDRYYRQITDNNRISAGFQYDNYDVGTTAAPNRSIIEKSLYLQDEWDITNRLNLTAGIRYVNSSKYRNQYLNSESLSYKFSDKVNAYISSSEFYITPNTTAIFGSAAFYPNSNIKPESGRTNEFGVKVQFDKKTYLNASLFNRKHENAIVIENLPGDRNIYTNINGTSHVKGGELEVGHTFGKYVDVNVGYSRLVADHDSQIPRLPKTQFTFDVTYTRDTYNIGIQALNRSDFAPNNYFPEGFKDFLPEKNYWVWNLDANVQLRKNLKAFAKIYNLFDKGYMSATQYTATGAKIGEPLAYYTASGRSYVFGVEYNF